MTDHAGGGNGFDHAQARIGYNVSNIGGELDFEYDIHMAWASGGVEGGHMPP